MPIGLRHFVRTREQMRRVAPIFKVLVRNGFGHFIQQITQRTSIPFIFWNRRKDELDGAATGNGVVSAPRRLVMVLYELGPTFVKLGQMLSTRTDLLPDAYITELKTLTEDVQPFDTRIARNIVESELGRPIPELFREFSDSPMAAGSVGQVYHAMTQAGERVVVKVKRPNIERTMLADLDLLELLAELLERMPEFKPLRPVMVVEEFRRLLRRELDFIAEASYTAKIRADLANQASVRVPAIHWELTATDVLTVERLPGISLNRLSELDERKLDRLKLAADLVNLFLHQFFKTGFFHADPHSGNILIDQEGHISLVDFGITGRLDPELRRSLATSFVALAARDLDIITDVYMDIGVIPEETDRDRLKSDLNDVLDKYYGIPSGMLDLRQCFADAMRVARVHHVRMPSDFVLLAKSFATVAATAREISPEFDFAEVVKPYALSIVGDKLSPSAIGRELASELWQLSQMLRRFPRGLRQLVRKALSGNLQFALKVQQFDQFAREIDRATNRLAFSIIVSAIVLGSSVLLHADVPPHMQNVLPGSLGDYFATHMPNTSALGLGGFLIAGVLGMLLAVAIWRRGRL